MDIEKSYVQLTWYFYWTSLEGSSHRPREGAGPTPLLQLGMGPYTGWGNHLTHTHTHTHTHTADWGPWWWARVPAPPPTPICLGWALPLGQPMSLLDVTSIFSSCTHCLCTAGSKACWVGASPRPALSPPTGVSGEADSLAQGPLRAQKLA